ncbi:transport-associated protein [Desulfovibrio mangrovi]|uniref:transport-associated protein n=1 Tax=Desulfovibrio mangrovi TaxID=2976983 RepID=UPI00224641DF|nr:transport-associated protein [Desulfovibrio mangrovi]UZP67330.1 transport-associated protein [Desulfovibrio mangrovi]
MTFARLLLVAMLMLSLALPLAGCKEEGPAEKAGKKIDEAMDSAKEGAKKLFE